MTTTKTAPPSAAIVASGGATIPGVELRPPGAEAPPVSAGVPVPAVASVPSAHACPGGTEALDAVVHLSPLRPTAASSAAGHGVVMAEEAQTTGRVALGGGARPVSADGRLTRSRPSATTSTGRTSAIGGGVLPAADISILEAFAGPGGLSEGARMVGLTGGFGIDLNADACATAEAAGHRRFCGSIRDIDPEDFPAVEGWVSAPPCPTFTRAGKQSGLDDYGMLLSAISDDDEWRDMYRRIHDKVTDPRTALVLETLRFASRLPNLHWLVAEQVPAVQGIWEEMAWELAAMGPMHFVDVVTIRADDLGAATRRERTFLIAARHQEPDFTGLPVRRRHKAGKYGPPPALVESVDPVEFPRTTMAEALGWPPGIRVNTRGARKTAGGNEFSADGPTPSMTGNGTRTWYRTDLGSVAGRLTSAEAGMLQGFPLDYPWQGSRTSQFQRVADTVSPIVAAAVIGVASGRPWQDAVWRRLEELYGVEVPGQLDLFAGAGVKAVLS